MSMPTAKRGATKTTAAKQAGTKTTTKQTSNQGLMKAVQPSAALAAIVGTQPLPRTEITN
jgi:upstream activation factor subunit UAF30